MDLQIVEGLLNYADKKKVFHKDLQKQFEAGFLTLDEYYNELAGRIRKTTSSLSGLKQITAESNPDIWAMLQ